MSTEPIIYSKDQIEQLDSGFRRNLINSCTGFKPAGLIATKSSDGRVNLAVFNSFIHIGASPAAIGFLLRPHTVPRHTYENIKETGYYTINHIPTSHTNQAHQTSAPYPKEVSEFEAVGFTQAYHEDFTVPYVEQSPVRIGMKIEETHTISLNSTILVVGTIQWLSVAEPYVGKDGFIELDQLGVAAIGGLDRYYSTNFVAQHKTDRIETTRPIG